MSTKTTRQFGLWPSPLSARQLSHSLRLEAVRWDSDGRTLVWLEGRSGRGVLVAQTDDEAPRELTSDLSVRAEVGYGGGDFAVHGGHVYFVQHRTGRLFKQALRGGIARAITPAFGKASSPAVSPDGRWLAFVHQDDEGHDRLAVVDADGAAWPRILASGHDFYMQPRWSPAGNNLAWVAWDHPNMPWDGTFLELAAVDSDARCGPILAETQCVAGGSDVAIFQPEFTSDGQHLVFVSDETGWGRLAILDLESRTRRWLTEDGSEFNSPAWVQDLRTYALSRDGRRIWAASSRGGLQQCLEIDVRESRATPLTALSEYTELGQLVASPATDEIALVGSHAKLPPRVVRSDVDRKTTRVVVRSACEAIPAEALANCEPISWPTANGETAHGLLYSPASSDSSSSGSPPLIVIVHGGPTSQVRAGWRAEAQFFATRGYAVLFVNYRGSTGYGREYMLRLRGHWGVCDVEDSISGAEHLARSGRVDSARRVIMGGSAGGFTVLQAMTQYPTAFTAGISLYGVADQFGLAADTHKFESRYLDTMLGPLPEAAALYRERSPLFYADRICRPLAVFQGDIDQIVPRCQSDQIVEALRRRGIPHVYHVYEGEGHGWRKQETIEHFHTSIEEFLKRHVLFA